MYTPFFELFFVMSSLFQVSQQPLSFESIQSIHAQYCVSDDGTPIQLDKYVRHKDMLRTLSYAIDNPLLFLVQVTDEENRFPMDSFRKRYNTMRHEGDLHNFVAFDILLKFCHPQMTMYLYDAISLNTNKNDTSMVGSSSRSPHPSLRNLMSRMDTNSLFKVMQIRRILIDSPSSNAYGYVNVVELAEMFHRSVDDVYTTLQTFRTLADLASQYTGIDQRHLCYEDAFTEIKICHPILSFGYILQAHPSISSLIYKCQHESIQLS